MSNNNPTLEEKLAGMKPDKMLDLSANLKWLATAFGEYEPRDAWLKDAANLLRSAGIATDAGATMEKLRSMALEANEMAIDEFNDEAKQKAWDIVNELLHPNPPETSSADCHPQNVRVPSCEKLRPGSADGGGETALQIIESKIREYEGCQSPPAWMLLLQFRLTYGSKSAANLAKLRTRLREMRAAHLHKDALGPAITIGRVLFEIDAIYGKAESDAK